MALLWLANISIETPDEDLHDFLERYGFPPADSVSRVGGDGPQPIALVDYQRIGEARLRELALRIDGVFWQERRLHASVADARHM